MQLSLRNPLKPCIDCSSLKCSWSIAYRRCSNYIWVPRQDWSASATSAATQPIHVILHQEVYYEKPIQIQIYPEWWTILLPTKVRLKLEWVDENTDTLSHPCPYQFPLPRGHIVVVIYIRASYWLPSFSFHDNQASHSRDTIWPWKFKVKGKGQKYPSQHSILLTHFLSVSHQGILSTPVPFVLWQSGIPFPGYNLTLKIQGQRSKSKVKVKGTLVSIASSWLISFLFHFNWTNRS